MQNSVSTAKEAARHLESILEAAKYNTILEMEGTFDPDTRHPENAIGLQCISCRRVPTRASPQCACHPTKHVKTH